MLASLWNIVQSLNCQAPDSLTYHEKGRKSALSERAQQYYLIHREVKGTYGEFYAPRLSSSIHVLACVVCNYARGETNAPGRLVAVTIQNGRSAMHPTQ